MSRRNDEQRARDAAQARARRLRRKLAAVPFPGITDCHGGYGRRSEFRTRPTARELVVLAEACQHGDVQEAASCLRISYSTARNHLSSLYQRLGAVSLPQALLLLGWVDVPSRVRRPHPLAQQIA